MTDSVLTWIIIASVTVALIVWDVYVVFFNTEPNRRDSISGVLRTMGSRTAGVPFVWGGLGGHFWGPSIEPALGKWSIPVLVVITIGGLLSHVVLELVISSSSKRLPVWTGLVYLGIGTLCGALLWPQ